MTPAEKLASLQELYDLCRRHDWFYDMSDDPSVYRSGLATAQLIGVKSALSLEHEELALACRAAAKHGAAWPPRPGSAPTKAKTKRAPAKRKAARK